MAKRWQKTLCEALLFSMVRLYLLSIVRLDSREYKQNTKIFNMESLMSFRLFLVLALMFTATACSKNDAEGDLAVTDGSTMNAMDGSTIGGQGGVDGSIVPGSQQDLAQNVGDRVFFAYDSYDLSPEARATLDRQAQWLNQYGQLSITIEGHADERGTREYNLALGEKRANSVKSYLSTLGVDSSRLNVISYGKERPEVAGDEPGAWAQNRRSVTVVQ